MSNVIYLQKLNFISNYSMIINSERRKKMENVKKLALEVFEGRKEAEKRIPKVILENLEDYVKNIIEIFKISNLSEKSTVLVWQVRLYYKYENIFFMFSFKEDGCEFYNKTAFESRDTEYGNNETLREYIEDLKIPTKEAKNISKYFKENLSEYFEVEDNNNEYIMIKMKRKRDPMNCTN